MPLLLGQKLAVRKVVLSEGHAEEPVDAEVIKTPFKASDSPGTGLLKTGAKL